MKTLIKTSYLFTICLLASNYKNLNLIEKIYFFIFVSVIIVFIDNPKIILTEHLIYSFLVCTFSLCCNNKMIMISGLIASGLWYYSQYIQNTCYFLELQFKKGKTTGMIKEGYFNIAKKIFDYTLVLAVYKIFYGKIHPVLNTINYIIALIIGAFILHEILIIWKINKNNYETLAPHMYADL
jgi:hypothetical protein